VAAANNTELEASFPGTPLYHRLQIFNQIGMVEGGLAFKTHEDINLISVEGQ